MEMLFRLLAGTQDGHSSSRAFHRSLGSTSCLSSGRVWPLHCQKTDGMSCYESAAILCYLCPTTFSFYRLKPRSTCMFYISITDNKQKQKSRLVNLVQFFFSLFLGLCQLKLPSSLTFTVSRLIYWIVLWVAVNSDVLSTLLVRVK